MIGGTDIVIPVVDAAAALEYSLKAVVRFWPRAVYQDADSGETFSCGPRIEFGSRRSFFVYRDLDAASKWDELGADESLDGTMIHFLARPGELTVVVDSNPPRVILTFLEDLQRGLSARKALTRPA